MKHLLFMLLFAMVTFIAKAQSENNKIYVKSDTLFVPVGTAKFIKIGDKVYQVMITLQEVPDTVPIQQFPRGIFLGNGNYPYGTVPANFNTELKTTAN